MITVRDYQEDIIQAVEDQFRSGVRRTAVVAATGLGKTVTFAEHIRRTPDARTLVLVHRDHLVKQAHRTIAHQTGAHVGVVKAQQDDRDARNVVASVLSMVRRLAGSSFDRIVVDECHHATAPTYQTILAAYPDAEVVGYTATLSRSDQGKLGNVWQSVASSTYDIQWGISHGYLTDVQAYEIQVDGLDLDRVLTSRGDLAAGSLGNALIGSGAHHRAAEAYLDHARLSDGTLRQGIVFCPDVISTAAFTEAFLAAGIATAEITGATSDEDREKIYQGLADKSITVVTNCMVLTEGFDLPQISCLVVARATTSQGLYTQMVGRGLRPWPGKDHCMIMDITGVCRRHTLISFPDLSQGQDDPAGKPAGSQEEQTERTIPELSSIDGQLSLDPVDVFGRSKSAWLTTTSGTWFLPTRAGYIFLRSDPRDPGMLMVGKTADQYRKQGGEGSRVHPGGNVTVMSWGWVTTGIPMDLAMSEAEQLASRLDPSVSERTASWRSNRRPSENQISLLDRLGINPSGMTRSMASDALSIHYASKIL